MAKINVPEPPFIERLKKALIDGLATAGIEAEVETEPVQLTKLYRVSVIAWGFKHMPPSERQDFVWKIAGNALDREEQLRISMIVTLTPDELDTRWTDDEKVQNEIECLKRVIKYLKAHTGKPLNVRIPNAPFEWEEVSLKSSEIPRKLLDCQIILQNFRKANRFLHPATV